MTNSNVFLLTTTNTVMSIFIRYHVYSNNLFTFAIFAMSLSIFYNIDPFSLLIFYQISSYLLLRRARAIRSSQSETAKRDTFQKLMRNRHSIQIIKWRNSKTNLFLEKKKALVVFRFFFTVCIFRLTVTSRWNTNSHTINEFRQIFGWGIWTWNILPYHCLTSEPRTDNALTFINISIDVTYLFLL